jgi:hypothetical protein
VKLSDESASGFLRKREGFPHAVAGVEHQRHVDRHVHRRELRNGLPPSFFEDREVSRSQVAQVTAGTVGDRHREGDELHT